jgi:microcystin-dependent protein
LFVDQRGRLRTGLSDASTGTGLKSYNVWGDYNTNLDDNGFLKSSSATSGSALVRSDFPVGIPQPWPTNTAPAGWLKCNGAAFDKAKYPLLAVAYPSGTLPDLRGVFIRGWDDGRGLDAGRALLTYAADKLKKHHHSLLFGNGDGSGTPAVHELYRKNSATTYFAAGGGSGIYISEEGANETAPCNIAFNYIVRAA